MIRNFFFIIFLIIFLTGFSSAKELGPGVSVYNGEKLTWDAGSYWYYVMYQNQLSDGSNCIDEDVWNKYTLYNNEVPRDALVKRAFLVWTGTQPLDGTDKITDNEVYLKYESTDKKRIVEKPVIVQGYKLSESKGFNFDALIEPDDSGRSYFTYRADVTDFFEDIHAQGQSFAVMYDGYALLGEYTVSSLQCSNDIEEAEENIISGWALVIVYLSNSIMPKEINIYDGFQLLENGTQDIDFDSFGCKSVSDSSCVLLTSKGVYDFTYHDKNKLFSNLLITATESKMPMFDIPIEPELVACTPSNTLVLNSNPESKWCKGDLEHTFTIRIQNWGANEAENVIVRTEIPEGMEYVPDSTKYSTDFYVLPTKRYGIVIDNKIAKDWTQIPDAEKGGFPLSKGYRITDKMEACQLLNTELDYSSCENTIFVNYKVKIKSDVADTFVFESIAEIESVAGIYKTNQSVPFSLKPAAAYECVDMNERIKLTECGYKTQIYNCQTNDDCYEGDTCCLITGTAIGFCNQKSCGSYVKMCSDYYRANPDPSDPLDETVFVSTGNDVILGSVKIYNGGTGCVLEGHIFDVQVKFSDKNIKISNARLIFADIFDYSSIELSDINEKAQIIATSELKNGFLHFFNPNYLFFDSYNHYALVVDLKYEKEVIPENAVIEMSIEKDGISVDGNLTEGLPFSFRKIQIEPSNSIIVSRGSEETGSDNFYDDYDPKYERSHDFLQFQVLSKGSNDKIKSITVKFPEKSMAETGKKVSSLGIFIDTDKDGKGDELVVETKKMDSSLSHKFNVDISLPADVPEYFTINGRINLETGKSFRLQIAEIEMESGRKVFGLPVTTIKIENDDEDDFGSSSLFGCSVTLF